MTDREKFENSKMKMMLDHNHTARITTNDEFITYEYLAIDVMLEIVFYKDSGELFDTTVSAQ